MSLLMWGVVYQGYNAIFPSFYPELFPTRTRVSAMAISQNIGTTITALLPALFATVAPPGSANIPLTVGAIAFGITVIAALAAVTARETYGSTSMISEIPTPFRCRRQTMRGCELRPQVEQPSFRRDGWMRPEETMKKPQRRCDCAVYLAQM